MSFRNESLRALSDVELTTFAENTKASCLGQLSKGDDGFLHAHDENYFSWLEKEIFAAKREMDERGMDAKTIIGSPWA